ncbi:MAG: HEAT repeat domain-containing protein [Rhodanobacteraceae bacterium]|nr:HEAT repeat domain-containing protein [Rhodanobacteraceae bacterium]
MKVADKELNQLYSQGQEFMAKSDWRQALDSFARLEKRMVERGESNVDTAVFWQAYVLVQAKRVSDARRMVDRLRDNFPQSRWIAEAENLLRQDEPDAETELTGSGDGDKELAEIAVEGLMSAPPERALPLLRKVLHGKQPEKVKRRALFVLTQMDSREAVKEIIEVARKGDPVLRDEAIRMLGVSGDGAALAELESFYKSASTGVRREVLRAWMNAERQDLVLSAARDEADLALRSEAIQLLGAMQATAELKRLMPSVNEPELQKQIVESLGIAEDLDALVQIAGSHPSEAIRFEAFRAIGIVGGEKAGNALVALYSKAKSAAERDAVLHGLLISDDASSIRTLYKYSKSKEEKLQILRVLTAMGDDAALEIIEQELQ